MRDLALIWTDSSTRTHNTRTHTLSHTLSQEAVSQVDKHNAELLSELKRVQNQALEQVEASTRREADMYLKVREARFN